MNKDKVGLSRVLVGCITQLGADADPFDLDAFNAAVERAWIQKFGSAASLARADDADVLSTDVLEGRAGRDSRGRDWVLAAHERRELVVLTEAKGREITEARASESAKTSAKWKEEEGARLRLIAAAPDLLEALERMEWLSHVTNTRQMRREKEEAAEVARAAIAKARGGK
jgi:hypothetical protein